VALVTAISDSMRSTAGSVGVSPPRRLRTAQQPPREKVSLEQKLIAVPIAVLRREIATTVKATLAGLG